MTLTLASGFDDRGMESSTRSRPRRAWLFSLLMVTFAIGTDDFVVAGALPAISRDLAVSEGTTGQLVTVFSLAYAFSAPVMAVLTSRVPPRRLLGLGLTLFAALNFATALATSFEILLVLRIVTAVVAGTLSPAAFAIAGQRAEPGYAGRAIGVVAAGLTVSLAVGVPIGTWLSTRWGWHATFVAVGVFTVGALVTVAATLPRFEPVSEAGIGDRLRALRSPAILACAVTTTIGACAGLMPYIYVAPISEALTARPELLTVFIATIGVAGALGAAVGGHIADGWGPDRGMIATFGTALVVVLVWVGLHATVAPVPPVVIMGSLAVWGVAAWGNNAPMNARTLALAGPVGTEAMALNTSGLYVGMACGSAIGGLVLDRFGVTGTLLAAIGIGVCGVAAMVISVRRWPTGRPARGKAGKKARV